MKENRKGQPLTEHLEELRERLIKSAIAVIICAVVSYSISDKLYAILSHPLIQALPEGGKVIFTNVTEAFFTYIKISITAGIFFAFPYVAYHIWEFVSPALYPNEKRLILPLVISSFLFFALGVFFCYFLVFPYGFKFLLSLGRGQMTPMPSVGNYFSFALKMLLVFGVIFEMPIVTFFLSHFGIVSYKMMKAFRKYAFVLSFVLGAILTPPDVATQLMLALPLIILYEASLVIVKIFGKEKVS